MVNSKAGFTLIEIIIILAIASLLLAIVFLASSQAFKARREQERKADIDRLIAAWDLAESNLGYTPAWWGGGPPSGYWRSNNTYTFSGSNPSGAPSFGVIYLSDQWRCSDDGGSFVGPSGGTKQRVAITLLESGLAYCRDND